MFKNLILGFVMLLGCLTIQCYVVSILIRVLIRLKPMYHNKPTLSTLTGVLMAVMLVMVAGNIVQAGLWAGLFLVLGEFTDFATAFYFSVVNYTTLGYGDIVLGEQHRILGALEAGNGIVMLGLTTSVLFLVLSTAMQTMWDERTK